MNRRTVLGRVGVLGAVVLAGCSSGGEPSDGVAVPDEEKPEDGGSKPLQVGAFDYRADDDGNLVVTVPVENRGSGTESGTLVVEVGVGDETAAKEESLTLDAGDEETFEFTFDVSVEAFEESGRIDVDVE